MFDLFPISRIVTRGPEQRMSLGVSGLRWARGQTRADENTVGEKLSGEENLYTLCDTLTRETVRFMLRKLKDRNSSLFDLIENSMKSTESRTYDACHTINMLSLNVTQRFSYFI